MASVDDCNLQSIRKAVDRRGTLAFVEGGLDIGFEIKRVYYTYDVPSQSTRAGHAHRALRQMYIAVSGAFDVVLDDGRMRRTVTLNRPDVGLTIVPGIWREIINFSTNAVLLVLASEHYDETDYIRRYADFRAAVKEGSL
jgi:dTDP-4-dehydrorhamnose 3,5-epimerase-like enzyme